MRSFFFSVHNDPVTFDGLKSSIAAVLSRFREQYPNLIDLHADSRRLNMAVSVCNTIDDIRREVTTSKKFSSEYESVDLGWGKGPGTHYFHENHEKYSESLHICRELIDAYSIREAMRIKQRAEYLNVATQTGNREYYERIAALKLSIDQTLSRYRATQVTHDGCVSPSNSFFNNPELTATKISHLNALRVTLFQAEDPVTIAVALENSISQNKEWEKYKLFGNGELGRCLEACLSLVETFRSESLASLRRIA